MTEAVSANLGHPAPGQPFLLLKSRAGCHGEGIIPSLEALPELPADDPVREEFPGISSGQDFSTQAAA